MIPLGSCQIWYHKQPIDFRNQIDGLILKIVSALEKDPADGSLYIFRNRAGDKLKCLVYDENGFVMLYKRICKKRFSSPKWDGETISFSRRQLSDLLTGDTIKMEPKITQKKPSIFF
jgi:transposase